MNEREDKKMAEVKSYAKVGFEDKIKRWQMNCSE
jgi:hypothetical protein